MNKLLIPILAGAMLPFTSLQAAPGKTFGGFKPGRTFTMTVTDRESIRTKGFDVDRGVAIPDSMPKFKEGQKITFTIGAKGALKGPGFLMKYRDTEGRNNIYGKTPSGRKDEGQGAVVRKTEKGGNPSRVILTFYKYRISGITPISNTVTYELKKK